MEPLTHHSLLDAFHQLASRLAAIRPVRIPVELLLVGGAAGVLAGYLPRQRTTRDCDVMVWSPPEELVWSELERLADEIGGERAMPPHWLNRAAGVFEHRLLPAWKHRRIEVMSHSALRLFVPGRVDYMAMKLLAGRDVDLDDVLAMAMTAAEAEQIRAAFTAWDPSHFAAGTIPGAIEQLKAIRAALDDHDSPRRQETTQ